MRRLPSLVLEGITKKVEEDPSNPDNDRQSRAKSPSPTQVNKWQLQSRRAFLTESGRKSARGSACSKKKEPKPRDIRKPEYRVAHLCRRTDG